MPFWTDKGQIPSKGYISGKNATSVREMKINYFRILGIWRN